MPRATYARPSPGARSARWSRKRAPRSATPASSGRSLRIVESAAAATGDPRRPFFLAWAYNGRAYVRARLRDFKGAASDVEAGLAAQAETLAALAMIDELTKDASLADALAALALVVDQRADRPR